MLNTKNPYVKHTINIFIIILGCFIMGIAFNIFYEPNNILLGGFGGIATIISDLLAKVNIHISISIIYLVINTVLYIFAVKTLGKTFAIYAIIGILTYSLALEVCKLPSVSDDLLLCSIYGGVIYGIGIGLIIRFGGSTGGGDMLGCIINHKKPKISVGWVTIFVNTIVIVISLFIYGLNLSLYSLIAIFISGKTSDLITEGPKSIRAFYIISSNPDAICSKLITELHRGATSFEAYGKYSGNHIQVILCLVSAHQVQMLKQIVYDIDQNAFLFSVSVKEAIGKGFHKLEKRKSFVIYNKKVKKPNTTVSNQNFTTSPSNQNSNLKSENDLLNENILVNDLQKENLQNTTTPQNDTNLTQDENKVNKKLTEQNNTNQNKK